MLIARGANVNATDSKDATPLHLAVESGLLVTVNLLLLCGAKINATNWFGQTPLHVATLLNHLEIIDFLLNGRVDGNTTDIRQSAPFFSLQKKQRQVDFLLNTRPDINAVDKSKHTPLWIAVNNNNVKAVGLFLSAQADPNVPLGGEMPLHCAAGKGSQEIVRMLFRKSR